MAKTSDLELLNWMNDNPTLVGNYLNKWSVDSCGARSYDKAKTAMAIDRVYRLIALPAPEKIWCDSIWQMYAVGLCWSMSQDFSLVSLLAQFEDIGNDRLFWAQLLKLVEEQNLQARLQSISEELPASAVSPFEIENFFDETIESLTRDLNERVFSRETSSIFNFVRVRQESTGTRQIPLARGITSSIRMAIYENAAQFVRSENSKATSELRQSIREQFSHYQILNVMLDPVQQIRQQLADGALSYSQWFNLRRLQAVQPWIISQSTFALIPYFLMLDFLHLDSLNESDQSRLNIWKTLGEGAFAYAFRPGVVLISPHPEVLHFDSRRRLHNEQGPAGTWKDGSQCFVWHGVGVSKNVILAPQTISIKEIESQGNIELRTVLIERYGLDRYIFDSGAIKIQEDQFGALYRKAQPNDEAIIVVVVQNATAEPDGTRRQYVLRVPPDMRTARQAIAWSFGMSAQEFDPAVET